MRLDFRPSLFQQPNPTEHFLPPILKPVAQQTFNYSIFRPFLQPFLQHPFVRIFIHPIIQPPFVRPVIQPPTRPPINPITTTAPTPSEPLTTRNWDGKDPTLRPDDPYVASLNKRSFDARQASDNLTREGAKWDDLNGDGRTSVAYSFNTGFGQFDERQKAQARLAMQAWSDVSNLAFEENGPRREGKMSFGISNTESVASGYYPSNHPYGGSTWYNPNRVTRQTMLHETGHALGLSHGGNYNGSLHTSQWNHAQDSKAHTVMSYFWADKSGKTHGGNTPVAPMMDDISAIQKLYGVNRQIRQENTTYGFNSNSQRDYYTLNSNRDHAVFCVWDGGGIDTLDVSGYGSNQTINLKAGSFSDVGGLKGNVSIARGVTLENAIGGSGNDALIGNEADNRLTGGAGGDRLRGGGGADTFVYNRASDSTPDNPDVLMDFISGTDKIDVSRAMKHANVASLAFVSEMTGKAGDAVLIHDASGNKGSVAIDLTGDGKADLLIRTHGQVKPGDIVQSAGAVTLDTQADTPSNRATLTPPRHHRSSTYTYEKASDSTYHNADLLQDFVSGQDKIDLTGLINNTGVHLQLVERYTGRIGDTLVKFNAYSGRYFVGVDLTGNRRTDFLIKSTQRIKPEDVIGLPKRPNARANAFSRAS
ncbi:M10 family metallopeptidase C-terminal domain-containing protein [Pseudomonas fluorescens]|uniref:M10 family metallopeptidase C-terminal domain-containing protein n=1 Tax=Pseudomonas fluorescens TaxID=294 RepID=UPI0021CD140C|nr:M10 family metallopeptidase C-terminal domain-containing protein [Pseudomonas fluorescens]